MKTTGMTENLRRVLSVGLLSSALLLAPAGFCASIAEEDSKIADEMGQRLASIQEEIAASTDPAAILKLEEAFTAIVNESLPRLSPKSRAPLLVMFSLVRPTIKTGSEYMHLRSEFWGSPPNPFRGVRSVDDIKLRLSQVESLHRMNQKVLEQLNSFDTRVDQLLAESDISPEERKTIAALVTASVTREFSFLVMVRNLDTKILALVRHACDHLEKHSGAWQAYESGVITWVAKEFESQFESIIAQIALLTERQNEAERLFEQSS